MVKRLPKLPEVTGSQGLLLSVIWRATVDAAGMDGQAWQADALSYFESDLYKHHLQLLGLPVTWRPAALEEGAPWATANGHT